MHDVEGGMRDHVLSLLVCSMEKLSFPLACRYMSAQV